MLKSNENKRWFGIMVAIVGCLFVVGVARADWVEQDKLLASDGAAEDRFGAKVSISGDYAIVGAILGDGNVTDSGSAYIFKRDPISGNWVQQAKLTASDGAADDYFGVSVYISGDFAIVGAYWDDDKGTNSGSAYIFKRDGESWVQQAKLTASDGASDDTFGGSVSISTEYAIVAAAKHDDNGTNSGAAYIFMKPSGGWVDATETAKLTASDGGAGDFFGVSVSLNGDFAIVGAYRADPCGIGDSGAAYVFKRDGTSWLQQAKLTASDGEAGDTFGVSTSINGNYAIVGANRDDDRGTDAGSAYIFKRDPNGESWEQQVKLTAWDGAAGEHFGSSVRISGDYAIVGEAQESSGPGSAYIFKRSDLPSDPNWYQQAKLIASDGELGDEFGFSVSMSGNYAIVGVNRDDDAGTDSGSAYIFVREPILVEIDIKPGSYPNAINLDSHGLVPVAIFSSDGLGDFVSFDANSIDPNTVELAGASVVKRGKGKFMAHEEDVNEDGLLDLVVQVATDDLDPNSLEDGFAILTAKTYDGQDIEGQDEITIVPE